MLIKKITDLETQIEVLDLEEKLRLTANIIFMLMLYLKKQDNLNPFSFILKLSEHLNQENKEKFVENINSILESYLNQISTKKIDNSVILEKILDGLIKQGIIENPSSDESDSEEIDNFEIPEESEENEKTDEFSNYISFNEGLKFIIPAITVKFSQELREKSLTENRINFLETFNNEETIIENYEKHFSHINLFKFIQEIIGFSKEGLICFKKSRYTPKDRGFNTKIGELLILMGLLTRENLGKLLSIQEGETKMYSIEDNNIITVSTLPGEKFYLKTERKLLGELMVEFNLISQIELEKGLDILRWYNSVFSKKELT